MKTSKIIFEHFLSCTPLIERLCKENRKDARIIAIVITECYFNSQRKRIAEYIIWTLLTLIRHPRRFTLSVGIGQIQVKHWIAKGQIKDRPSIKNLQVFLNPFTNYDLAQILLHDSLIAHETLQKIIATYRGEARKYHYDIYCQLLSATSTYLNSHAHQ